MEAASKVHDESTPSTAMIVERSMHSRYLSNTYLVADGHGGPGLLIDAGSPAKSLIDAAERQDIVPTHVLLTHHHHDHVSEVPALRRRWPDLTVLIDPLERELLGTSADLVSGDVEAGQKLTFGELGVVPLRTPGHSAGMLSFLVGSSSEGSRYGASAAPGGYMGADAVIFTGDTLFRGSVGGVRAPGHTTYTDLRDSIMGTLMELPRETIVYPGHTDSSTIGHEWETNAFIRVWRGLDAEGSEACVALGEPATLVLMAPDYDGGNKAWVRWEDGSNDIIPGSQVKLKLP